MERNELDAAEEYLTRSLEIWPGLSTGHMNIGIIHFRRGDKAQALKWFWK